MDICVTDWFKSVVSLYSKNYLLPIDKYFKQVENCVKSADDGKMLYTTSQVLQKLHYAVLTYGL